MNDRLEGNIRPDHLAVVVQQRVRKIHIAQQLPLNLSVLRGKADKLIHNDGLIVKIERQCDCEIDKRIACQKSPRPHIDQKHCSIHEEKQYPQINTKLYVGLNTTL